MKKRRCAIAFTMVLLVTLSMPMTVLAAVHDVSSKDDVLNVFYTDTDAEVVLNMQNNIDMENHSVSGGEGQNYMFNGNGNAIGDVTIIGGDVAINADMFGTNEVLGNAQVTIDGNVQVIDVSDEAVAVIDGQVEEATARDDAQLEIAGNVERMYISENSSAVVEGELGYISVSNQSQAEITGNVEEINTNTDAAVVVVGNVEHASMTDQSQIEIIGDVETLLISENAVATVEGHVENASAVEKAQLEITGSLEQGNVLEDAAVVVNGEAGNIAVFGNGELEITGDVGSVNAHENAVVNITGDVTGKEESPASIRALENAQVNVVGNVFGENGEIAPEDQDDPNAYNMGADGIMASDNAVVYVTGNVAGGNGTISEAGMYVVGSLGDGGNAVSASENAKVTVGGNATGGNGMGTFGYGGNGVFALDSAVVNVGGNAIGGSVTANPEVSAQEDGNLYQSRGGNGVYAYSTATVNVGGDAVGGNTNGDMGSGGYGVWLNSMWNEGPVGTVSVGGTVSGGLATNETGIAVGDVYFVGNVGFSQSTLDRLSKVTKSEVYKNGEETAEYSLLSFLALTMIDDETYESELAAWRKHNGYGAEYEMWTDQMREDYSEDYTGFLLNLVREEVDLDTVDLEQINALFGAQEFAKLSIGSYDEDPLADSVNGTALANAYMNDNVKALPTAPPAETPSTGDTFQPMLVGTVAILAMLGMVATLVIRKKSV